jgi:hypothetical protein
VRFGDQAVQMRLQHWCSFGLHGLHWSI